MGVSLNGGTPKTSQHDHFLVGKPMVHCWVPPVVGNPQIVPPKKQPLTLCQSKGTSMILVPLALTHHFRSLRHSSVRG